MKVLMTGMSSRQCRAKMHDNLPNFPGYVIEALRRAGHTVDQRQLAIDDPELDSYDRIVMGLTPLGSLASTRAYGVLDAYQRLFGDPRLIVMLDAPDPRRFRGGLRKLERDPKMLFKPLFTKIRYEFALASTDEVAKRLHHAVDLLTHDTWPNVIVPATPWSLAPVIETVLPEGGRGKLRLGSVDALVYEDASAELRKRIDRPKYWALEHGYWDAWVQKQHLSWDIVQLPRDSRLPNANSLSMQMLRDASGCLISPGRYGLWWSPRFAQSIAQQTPIFTNWSETPWTDASFTILPANFEYTLNERDDIARRQHDHFLELIGSPESAVAHVDRLVTNGSQW